MMMTNCTRERIFFPLTIVNMVQDEITYFYKGGCPYSRKTHELVSRLEAASNPSPAYSGGQGRNVNHFQSRPLRVSAICVDRDVDGFKQSISEHVGRRVDTFPQIFVNKRHVGGYSDFANLFNV
jgi:glutaredoxin